MKILRLILGDQLNIHHSWFAQVDEQVTYVLMEVRTETDYATHHIQKVVGFFAAMRSFSETLRQKKHHVIYIKLSDKDNQQTFEKNIDTLITRHHYGHFEYQLPDEYRLDHRLATYAKTLDITHKTYDTEHFLTTREELGEFFKGKKTYLMERFYRHMRKKHDVLMDAGQPVHGQWNFDQENRKKFPKSIRIPSPLVFNTDVREILAEVKEAKVKTIGEIDAQHYVWPIDRTQALALLHHFTTTCLSYFGTYQDAMTPAAWSLYHSRLSFSMNIKLISPMEVVEQAITAWKSRPEEIDYNQVEGFVRQIIGWREYMRGIYWLKMPEYANLNFFNHKAKLPNWYWTGDTKMSCLKHSIHQSLEHAYAHHIQRLMITGNFALLAGIHPDEVDAWYLGVYIDALDWVEITNTRGMSQFADGGIVGTKPYVSSATYIDKMSHYCGTCHYEKNKKVGDKACPFNSLYWNFYDQHEDKLAKNPRIGMMYNVWKRMDPKAKTALLEQAADYLDHINEL
jgi:deoxyribodipyrimidine photolyase-related protein